MYPSMAPDQMGTRIPAAGDKEQQPSGSKRHAGADGAAAGEPGAEGGTAHKRARPAQVCASCVVYVSCVCVSCSLLELLKPYFIWRAANKRVDAGVAE